MAADQDTAYSCCSVGIGRWCWIVWASESDAREAAKPLATGYEKSSDAAEKAALVSGGPGSKRLPSKWASAYKRGGAGHAEGGDRVKPKSRLTRRPPANAQPAERPSFLYAPAESERAGSPGEVLLARHRIVRRTARKIYIDREPFREDEGRGEAGPADEVPKTRLLSVDREVLRREGRVVHRGSSFYASEAKGLEGAYADLTARHPWCAVLDVSFPCTTAAIKAAYRRLARERHPDAGGSPADFQALERAYREAVAYLSPRGEPSEPV